MYEMQEQAGRSPSPFLSTTPQTKPVVCAIRNARHPDLAVMYDADAKEISEPRSEDLLVDSAILGSERGMLDCGIFAKRYL
jgi:hypothetical protein